MPRPRSVKTDIAILTAAAELVGETGYFPVTIEAIAERAGVGKTTIYRRWKSKAEVMARAYAHLVPPADLHADTGSLRDDLDHLLGVLFMRYTTTPSAKILAGLIAEAQEGSLSKEALTQGIIDGRRDTLTTVVDRGLKRGEALHTGDARAACDLIVAMIWHRLLTDCENFDAAFRQSIIQTICGRRPKHD